MLTVGSQEWTRDGSTAMAPLSGMHFDVGGKDYEHPPADRMSGKRKASDNAFFKKHDMSAANVVAAYDDSNAGERDQGMRWYADAHTVARMIGGGDADRGAALLSTFSPQTDWQTNSLNAAHTIELGHAPEHGVGITGTVQAKANEIMSRPDGSTYGDLFDDKTAPKTAGFYRLIRNGGDAPGDTEGDVVIDRHALSVAAGRRLTKDDIEPPTIADAKAAHPDWSDDDIKAYRASIPVAPVGTQYTYQHIADMYREAAKRISERDGVEIAPHQVQAITWLRQQRKNNEVEAQLIAQAEQVVRQGGKLGSVPGAKEAKGRASRNASAWDRWEQYAIGHTIATHQGTTAVVHENPISFATISTQEADTVGRQLDFAGHWLTEHRGRHGEWVSNGSPDTVLGDTSTARHVVVLVPGTGSSDAKVHAGYQERAARLRDSMDAAGRGSTAVALWRYRAPGTLTDALDRRYADATSGSLRDYVGGIRKANPGAHVTVVGHSYGSTVAGVAAKNGMHADDLVFLGSPGVTVRHASNLGTPPTHVWSGAERHDPIARAATALSPDFMGNPSHPGFGAVRFDADVPGAKFEGMLQRDAHSSYFNPESNALGNVVNIATGHYRGVTHAASEPRLLAATIGAQVLELGHWEGWRHELRDRHGRWTRDPLAAGARLESSMDHDATAFAIHNAALPLAGMPEAKAEHDALESAYRSAYAGDDESALKHLDEAMAEARKDTFNMSGELRARKYQEFRDSLDRQGRTELYPGQFSEQILKYWRSEKNPTAKDALNKASAAWENGDGKTASQQLFRASAHTEDPDKRARYATLAAAVRDKAGHEDIQKSAGEFMALSGPAVASEFPGSHLDWDGKPPTIFEAMARPSLLAEIDWNGHVNMQDEVAQSIRNTLADDPKEPVSLDRAAAFTVPIHEDIHAILPAGQYRINNGDLQAYNADEGHRAIEEGFTELGTIQHAGSILRKLGIGDRKTEFLAPGLQESQEHVLATKTTVNALRALGLKIAAANRSKALRKANIESIDAATKDIRDGKTSSASSRLDVMRKQSWPEVSSELDAVDNAITALDNTPDAEHYTISDYADKVINTPQRIRSGDAWGHYAEFTANAFDWVDKISDDLGEAHDPATIKRLADEVNAVGTAEKPTVMARQLVDAAGVGFASNAERHAAIKAAEQEIMASWNNAQVDTHESARQKATERLRQMREQAAA